MGFTAKYPGKCGGCPNYIEPGQIVKYDDQSCLLHEECEAPVESPVKRGKICTVCFLEMPLSGEHDC